MPSCIRIGAATAPSSRFTTLSTPKSGHLVSVSVSVSMSMLVEGSLFCPNITDYLQRSPGIWLHGDGECSVARKKRFPNCSELDLVRKHSRSILPVDDDLRTFSSWKTRFCERNFEKETQPNAISDKKVSFIDDNISLTKEVSFSCKNRKFGCNAVSISFTYSILLVPVTASWLWRTPWGDGSLYWIHLSMVTKSSHL